MAKKKVGRVGALKERWNVLAVVAVWILSIVGTFMLPPPTGTQQSPQDSPVWHFGRFAIVIFLGFISVLIQQWSRSKHTGPWLACSLLCFISCFIAFFIYTYYGDRWTCKYDGQNVVVGSDLTGHGIEYVTGPGSSLTCEQRLWEHRGEVEELWTKDSIDFRRRLLAFIYLLSLLLFCGTIISVLQASYCSQRKN